MIDNDCAYCMEGELVDKFGIKICELPASKVYLFKEQSHKGRCIVASKHHVSEMIELSEEDRNAFIADVNHVAKAMHAAFHPDKVNYGAYGDTGHHYISIWFPSIRMSLSGVEPLPWILNRRLLPMQNMIF